MAHRTRIGLIILLLIHAAAWGDIPNHGPDAYTEKNYYEDVVTFLNETTTDAYQKHGRRDPAWDATVIKLLEGHAKQVANNVVSGIATQSAPTHKQMLKLGEEAIAAGCDDPVVLFVHGTKLRTLKRQEEAIDFLRRAAEGIIATDYCVMIKGLVVNRYLWTAPKEIPRRMELSAVRDELYHRAMLGKEMTGFAKRHMLKAFMPDRSVEELKGYVDAASEIVERDAWAYNYIVGLYHYEAGWAARGSGWASTVTEEGWKGFGEHMTEAARHLTAAWHAQPRFPEAPAQMIAVAMAGHGAESERVWFERAVQAQFDYMPAYNKLAWALRPRWGGSHRQMLAFALECAQTKRYDTEVPWRLHMIVDDIVEDGRGDLSIYRAPGMYEAFMELFDGMRDEPRRAKHRDYLYGFQAAMAWRCGRPDTARAILDEMGGEVSHNTVWGYVGARRDEAMSQIAALTGPAADRFVEADRLYGAGDAFGSMRAYLAARDALADGDAGRAHANRMVQLQRWRIGFGDMPIKLCGDDDLAENGLPPGWGVVAGQWSRPDVDTLIGVADENGLEARIPLGFGNQWEMAGVIDATETPVDQDMAVGAVVNHVHKDINFQVLFYPHAHRVRLVRIWKYGPNFQTDVPLQIPFKIQRWGDRYTVFLGDQMTISNDSRARANDNRSIGLGALKAPKGTAIRFTNLTIRRLRQQPAWFNPDAKE